MTKQERTAYWQRIIDKQAESGLSGAAFCREQQINRDRFYQWRRRLNYERSAATRSGAFVELVPYWKKTPAGVHVRLRNGLYIEVQRNFDPPTLRAAVQALCGEQTSPCLP